MTGGEGSRRPWEAGPQRLGYRRMMVIDLDFTEPKLAERSQRVEMVGVVSLDRVKERVTWRPAVGVAERAEGTRILTYPVVDTPLSFGRRNEPIVGFEVVGDRRGSGQLCARQRLDRVQN